MRRLLIRPGAIGDCIAALPAMEHLATDHTEAWVPSVVVPLIGFAERVRGLATTGIELVGVGDLEIPAKVRAELQGFDSIVSWYGANRPEFREAIASLGIACEFHQALPGADYRGHAVDFFARQVGTAIGQQPRIALEPWPARDSVVMHPFSGSGKKNWPQARYRELAARLDCAVEWTAGPEDEWPDAKRFDNLKELAGWIAGARLFIGNDSGIAHLAAATGIPTLVLFGPSSPQVWRPQGRQVTTLAASSLDQLSVDTVLAAVNRLLRSP
ncbi:MAG: glycosyltransferase family 9 protein [Acidobacteriaceae bacterium]|nr:glycosyltransferase family 9 protein [Acidobacteriaceae bacterium]